MIGELRRAFNASWDEQGYARLRTVLDRELGEQPGFRVAETPVFMPPELMESMVRTGAELTHALVDDREYLQATETAIPERYRTAEPAGVGHPHFMTVDLGFVREPDGQLGIRLVELQAFPSVLGFQDVLSAAYVEAYDLERRLGVRLDWRLGGVNRAEYWARLREVIVGKHDPAEVVLLEVRPETQKTRVDFGVIERELGVQAVNIEAVRLRGRQLEFERDGRWVPIRRVFNRAIAEEMERLGVEPGWWLASPDVDVEWAGHPNWYFRVSKFSLPRLRHPVVPRAVLLSDWMDDRRRLDLPLSQVLLKPLFSFAGRGIRFSPEESELLAIPATERRNYLLQERVVFAPVVETPEGATQAEVRIMYVWPDGGALQPLISMARLGRGLMMGVDQNRSQSWVGASAPLLPSSLRCVENV